MITLLANPADGTTAILFGTAGLAGQMIWPLLKRRERILAMQLGAACSYAASYALMGQQTATAICLTGATQTAVTLLAGNHPLLSRMGYVFLPLVLGLGALTFAGLPSMLAVTACCLVMIGRMQADTLRMRGIQLSASPFGAAHDVLVGAWPCLAGAVLTFTIAFAAFHRERRLRSAARPVA